jgi:nucleotide-binding universal stress UspA family protein
MPTTITSPIDGAVGTNPATSDVANPVKAGPLLVATDGSESADAAFIAARLLAQRSGAPVEVLTVLGPQTQVAPAPFPAIQTLESASLRMDALGEGARRQLHTLVGDNTGWKVEMRYGDPVTMIYRSARALQAELILTGLSKHGVLDRIFGEETNSHIAQVTDTPTMAVAAGTVRLPRSVLIAIDPGAPALPDTGAIRALLSDVETVYLVNVQPRSPDVLGLAPAPWDRTYEEGLTEGVERVTASLDLPAGVVRDLTVVLGNPAKQILRVAAETQAELLIVAQRRRGVLRGRMRGGLATQLLRGSTCSVLVIPQPKAHRAAEFGVGAPTKSMQTLALTDRAKWSNQLAEFSIRNKGRPAALEIDDTQLGAQAQVTDFPFLGADYDRTDDRVAIMLGNPSGSTSHLTHSIAAPSSLDILEDGDGKALALRVGDEGGQALLTFLA